MRIKKILKSIGLTVLAIFVGLTVIGLFVPQQSKPDQQQANAQKSNQASPSASIDSAPPEAASAPSSTKSEEEKKLAPKDAYAKFVADENTNIMAAGLTMSVSASQIQQAIEFKDLSEYRKVAESLEDALKKSQSDELNFDYPVGFTQEDQMQFDNLRDASENVLAQYVSTAADIGVNAHTGIDTSSAFKNDLELCNAALDKYKKVAQAGYRHFGVKPSQIDQETLQPKTGQSSEVAKS